MANSLPIPPDAGGGPGNKTRVLVALGAALLIGALAFYFVRGANRTPQPAAEAQTGLGPEERAYVANVGVDRLEISRAENFLHQEVTTISGEITNGGDRALAGVELTIEFYDQLNQIAQRETRSLFGPPGPPIPAGDHREFEVSFEHISTAWNMRAPAIKVTALQFSPAK
jgi:hypothetical protein